MWCKNKKGGKFNDLDAEALVGGGASGDDTASNDEDMLDTE